MHPRLSSRLSSRPASRRVLACVSLALAVPSSLLLRPDAGAAASVADAPPESVSVLAAAGQRVRVEALPQIVQHGARVASPDAAKAAVIATVRPVRPGRRVLLQVQHGEAWTSVARTRQDARGRAQFAWAAAADGQPLTYRVRAVASHGLRALTSAPVSAARWLDPTWTDEFSGTELAPVWNHRGREYAGPSRRSCAKGDPSAAAVADGALRLSVIKDPTATTRCRIRGRDAVAGRYAYRLNGHVGTEGAFAFRYGVAAARVKFHRLRGQHGAFWLQPVGGPAPGGSEIDVVEYFGDDHPQGGIASFVHRYGAKRNTTSGGWVTNPESFLASRRDGWSKNYHVFSVEWTPRSLVFRIDGKEIARRGGGLSDVRQFPILSLIAADYEIPKIGEKRLPQHMYVDWVRVWETAG